MNFGMNARETFLYALALMLAVAVSYRIVTHTQELLAEDLQCSTDTDCEARFGRVSYEQ